MNTYKLPTKSKETWSVTVLYEDTDNRQRAMQVGDHLMRQFWSEIEFDFNWWRLGFLEDPVLARQAGRHLADADVVILALSQAGELAAGLKRWLEEHLEVRPVRTGAFIVLFDQADTASPFGSPKDRYLRALAQRYGMDYLTEAPTALPGRLPDSLDGFSQRAEEHTTIIEKILTHLPPPRMYS
jgi:hypothetical protein